MARSKHLRPHRNRGIQPLPPFDIDTMSATDLLTSHEVAGLLRSTPGVVVEKWSGADPTDASRPLHPDKIAGRWLFTVGNVRAAIKDSFLAARLRHVLEVPKPDKPAKPQPPEKPRRRGGAEAGKPQAPEKRGAAPAARVKDPKEVEDDAPAKQPGQLRRMLSEEQVLEIVPVARATLYRMIAKGKFPRGTFISANRRVWFESEIVAWQDSVDEFTPNRRRGVGGHRKEATR